MPLALKPHSGTMPSYLSFIAPVCSSHSILHMTESRLKADISIISAMLRKLFYDMNSFNDWRPEYKLVHAPWPHPLFEFNVWRTLLKYIVSKFKGVCKTSFAYQHCFISMDIVSGYVNHPNYPEYHY